VKILSAEQQRLINPMRNSGRDELMAKADQAEDAAKDFWRQKKEQELNGADELMVRHYATSVSYARKYNVKNAYVTRAIGRLAYYTDILGDAKMQQYVSNTPNPVDKGATKLSYQKDMYLQTRPGLTALPPPSGDQKSAPVAP
jgi:hypothetical protein